MMAPTPRAMVPPFTPLPLSAGVSTWSVTLPSTIVPPTAITAKSAAPKRETRNGRGWRRADV